MATADSPPLPGITPAEPPWPIVRRPLTWLRSHPTAADGLLVTGLLFFPLLGWVSGIESEPAAEFREADALWPVLVLACTVPLTWRRRRPIAVFLVVAAAAVVLTLRTYHAALIPFGELIAIYTVAAHCSRRTSLRVLGGVAVAVAPVVALSRHDLWGEPELLGNVVSVYLLYGLGWVVGDNLKTRRANVAALQERAERAERDREEEARRAVEAERTRIAREMHDVVAHSMSVMVVQASGAQRVIDKDPARAAEALSLIEATGREGLTEMRRLLGVLREEAGADDGAERAPQPSLDRLDALVDDCRRGGLPVTVTRLGEPSPLPPGLDLAAYRIVQEALTNVRRHAGPATAEVTITHGQHQVVVDVLDDGRGLGADPGRRGGHGLVGMRERAALFGGTVETGPRPGGGFAVRAVLPLQDVAP